MNNDLELLELAAKAAGYDYTVHHHGGQEYSIAINGVYWNPLHYDGDALRLAVKLGISLKHFPKKEYVIAKSAVCVGYKGYPYAATRRAIVRAAAEIGRDMK